MTISFLLFDFDPYITILNMIHEFKRLRKVLLHLLNRNFLTKMSQKRMNTYKYQSFRERSQLY